MTIATIYPFLNAAHILGLALLLGAALPMDLRLIGAFRSVPLPVIVPFLSRVAGTGLGLAVVTGICLFLVNPSDYLANAAFRLKAVLIAAAVVLVVVQHRSPAFRAALAGHPPAVAVRITAAASAVLWVATLTAGRWIGFL
ncbi:MAG: DUF2214 domain-containing protein [Paracoccaceae bacterium]|nr:MAG: DUF2214 domain-containing protein [Paracoccaceae bacterium]